MEEVNVIDKLKYIFCKRQKFMLLGLVFLIFLGACFDLLGVSLILPFVTVVTNPSAIVNNPILHYVYTSLNMPSYDSFLVLIAIVLIMVYILKNAYGLWLYNIQCKFIYRNQLKLSIRLMRAYMDKNYLYHVQKNTAELQRSIQSDTQRVFALVMSCIQFLSELIVSLLLVLYLMTVDMTITITTVVLLGTCFLLYFKMYRKKIIQYGKNVQLYGGLTIKSIVQAFSGIKDIKVLGREQFFIDIYERYSYRYIESQRKNEVLSQVPRHVIETICIGGILSVIVVKLINGVDINVFIPQLSVFAFAAFRLLPSVNRISSHVNTIIFQKVSLDLVYNDLKEAINTEFNDTICTLKDDNADRKMNSLNICNICFKYPGASEFLFENVSFSIPFGKSVALIGSSGVGKTTLVDIILNLLSPQKGGIYYENTMVSANKEFWIQKIAYIPQSIYLADDTIRNNIAFGVMPSEIDDNIIYEVLRQAQLYDFVFKLNDGIDTVIGEQGVKMSGGQRQRLGIARALYTNPKILIFDEATSALDGETECALMESIDSLKGQKTLIIIAHRLQTIKKCDTIYRVENNTITKVSSFLDIENESKGEKTE